MKEKEDKGGVIEAAGGLVWREEPDGKRIAIIHRTIYGEEWTLPKGKLGENETWKEAAEREVKEELGCDKLRMESFAGSISYIVKGKPKIVLFWNMVAEGDCKFKKSKEVDRTQWLPVHEALELLRYPKERALLKDAASLNTLPSQKSGNLCRLKKILKSQSHKRLDAAIGPFELELRTLIDQTEEKLHSWAERSLQMVQCANQALHLCEIELGWRYFYTAQLLSIHFLNPESLQNLAQATLNEAEEKLSGWRKETVQNLLGKDGVLKDEKPSVNDVYEARKILQEHHTNTHIKLSIAQFQLEILAPIAFVLIATSIVVLTEFSGQIEIYNPLLLLSIAIFGAIGGTISGIVTIARGSTLGKIPDQLLSSWLTISRPIFGAMSALAISMFLLSGLIKFGDLQHTLVLAISIIAGISERLLLSAVEKVS